MINERAKVILDFCFVKTSLDKWFKKDDDFDNQLRKFFLSDYKNAVNNSYDEWQDNPEECVALIMLLDQLSRNFYRNSPKAYEQDYKCRLIVNEAVDRGFLEELSEDKIHFLLLPLIHSEDISDHIFGHQLINAYLKNHIEYGNFINFPNAHELLINRNQIDYNFFEPPCLSNPLFWDIFFLNCITKEDYLSRLDILSSGSDNILEYFSRHNFYSLVWNNDLFYNHIGCLMLSIEVLKTTINEFFNKLKIVTNRVEKINYFIGVFKSNNHKYFLRCKCTTKSKKVKTNIFLDIKEANNTAEDLDLYVYSCPYASEFTGIKNYQYHLTSNYRLV